MNIETAKRNVKNIKNTVDYLHPNEIEAIETVLSELENKQDNINILQAQRDSMEYQFKQTKAELEKKDKVINEMAEWITKIDPTIYCDKSKCDDNCKECVIKGFTNKVEREGK